MEGEREREKRDEGLGGDDREGKRTGEDAAMVRRSVRIDRENFIVDGLMVWEVER